MTPALPMQSGPSPSPDGKASAPSPSSTTAPRAPAVRKKKKKAPARKHRTVLGVAPNGNDHAVLLVGLGFFVAVVLFAIIRVVVASHY